MLGTVEEGVMGFDVIYLVGVDVSKDFGGEWAAGGVFIPDFCFLLRCFFFFESSTSDFVSAARFA